MTKFCCGVVWSRSTTYSPVHYFVYTYFLPLTVTGKRIGCREVVWEVEKKSNIFAKWIRSTKEQIMNEDYRSLLFRIDFSLELGSMSVLIQHLKCKTLKYLRSSLFCISIKSGSAPDLLILISSGNHVTLTLFNVILFVSGSCIQSILWIIQSCF